jgi:flagellar basal-body rod protein FlgB
MALTDIPIFSMLRTRLEWAQARQRVLAENVANADTPNFRPTDLAPLKFDSASHGVFRTQQRGQFDIRASGNGVNLEDQMMKVAANQMDYQAVSALYARSLNMLKTAIGKA